MIRQVSCYTLLSGCQPPWPPTCCLYQLTPLLGSYERKVRHLNPTFGSSHSASSAYQKWPTWTSHSMSAVRIKQPRLHTHSEFEISLKHIALKLVSFALSSIIEKVSSYPGGNFKVNQLLDSSISLSPLYISHTIDLHVRNASDLHQSFLWLHPAHT